MVQLVPEFETTVEGEFFLARCRFLIAQPRAFLFFQNIGHIPAFTALLREGTDASGSGPGYNMRFDLEIIETQSAQSY